MGDCLILMVVILFFLAITPGVSGNVILEINRRACRRFAKPHGLQLTDGRYVFLGPKMPLVLRGDYLGRKLVLPYSPSDLLREWGPRSTSYYELLAKSAGSGSVWLRKKALFQRGGDLVGDPDFDRCITTRSRPKRFAAELLADPNLRGRVRTLVYPIRWGSKVLNITKGGWIKLYEEAGVLTVRLLEERFSLLSELADTLESNPD